MIVDFFWNKSFRVISFIIQIFISDSLGFGRVKVGVVFNVGVWEVGVRKEVIFVIKGRVVIMEVFSEEDYDVSLFFMVFADVGIGYFSETQWCGIFLYAECFADGFECGIFIYFGGVILDVKV